MQNDPRLQAFQRLLDIMDDLREKCPWDRKQTLESLSYLSIEEIYELQDAILKNDLEEVKKEIGDILLHCVFYAKIGSEQKAFDITSVLNSVCDKLIERHPHIYGDVKADTEEEVKSNWEKIKLKSGKKSVLEGVPNSLPAMVKAVRIQEKARGVGFDWSDSGPVMEKIEEEIQELKQAVDSKNTTHTEEEFGDLLFSLVNISRFLKVNPETALEKTNLKFIARFKYIEDQARAEGRNIQDLSLSEMEAHWQQAKGKV